MLIEKKDAIFIDLGGRDVGNMNVNKKFYPETMSAKECKDDFLKRRILLGNIYGFDGKKIYMANQEKKSGTYKVINDDIVKSCDDGWDIDIAEDILIVTAKTPGVVIGHPVADCPVVMMNDAKKGIIAVCHCSADLIDKKLPMMVADAMCFEFGSRVEDIFAYVSSCAGKDTFSYDSYPKWATDSALWENCILEKGSEYYIDLRSAIEKQFEERNILNYYMNYCDTITNDSFYSNNAAFHGKKEAGRNFAGAYYKKI